MSSIHTDESTTSQMPGMNELQYFLTVRPLFIAANKVPLTWLNAWMGPIMNIFVISVLLYYFDRSVIHNIIIID